MLRLALPQLAPIWLSRSEGLAKVIDTIKAAKGQADLIVFSEGFVPGYPFWLDGTGGARFNDCLLYTSPSPRDQRGSRMPSSA